jgi:3-dehydroquinate synthase
MKILRAVDNLRLDRQSYIVAAGGGAFLDAVGLAATLAHRGLRLIRIPTTTLSQADSGVGVKNSVNAFGKKNFIGTFAPPWAVVNDFNLLEPLPARDKRAGCAEAVKVALIRDAAFFERLEADAWGLARFECEPLRHMIRRCAELHLDHICAGGDPFEMGSARPLDFGHWSAHKLEVLSNHRLRHGEAVAIGIALDTLYAKRLGWMTGGDTERTLALLERLGFSLYTPELLPNAPGEPRILEGLSEFQEHLGGELTLSLPRGIGLAGEVHTMNREWILDAAAKLKQRAGA